MDIQVHEWAEERKNRLIFRYKQHGIKDLELGEMVFKVLGNEAPMDSLQTARGGLGGFDSSRRAQATKHEGFLPALPAKAGKCHEMAREIP